MEQLNPLTKLLMLVCLSLLVFSAGDMVVTAVFILLGIVAFWQRKKLLREFLGIPIINKRLLFILPLFIPLFWLIYRDMMLGSLKGIIFLFRLGILMVSALIFVSTTGQDELINTLMVMKVPYGLAFMFTIAIRFVPVLIKEFKQVMDAQRARAYKIRPGNIQALVVPTVILLLKRAYEISLAMYTRGFRPEKGPRPQPLALTPLDYVVMILAAAAAAANFFLDWNLKF
jgi:energy-coupling factor transport system permease protein